MSKQRLEAAAKAIVLLDVAKLKLHLWVQSGSEETLEGADDAASEASSKIDHLKYYREEDDEDEY